MKMKFDFSMPMDICGFHSGWNEGVDPTKTFGITHRRNIYLFPELKYEYIALDDDNPKIPFMVKRPKSKGGNFTEGVSSGGGCSLFRSGNKTYKFKRNGLYDQGFPRELFLTNDVRIKNNCIQEFTGFQHAGYMLVEDIKRIIQCSSSLKKDGFQDAYALKGFYKFDYYVDEFDKKHLQTGSILWEVKSDLRADELVFCSFTPLLYNLTRSGVMEYNQKNNMFDSRYVSLSEIVKEDTLSTFDKVISIGKSLGSVYRNLHELGYLRGYGNCWFGNEVFDKEGNITIVDLDSMFTSVETRTLMGLKEIQEVEKTQAMTNLYFLFENYDSLVLGYLGNILLKAFNEGYEKGGYKLNQSSIESIIQDHLSVYKPLFKKE